MELRDVIPYLTVAVTLGFWSLVFWGLWSIARGRGKPVEVKTPEEHLADLLRRGEIDEREYQERLVLIGAVPAATPAIDIMTSPVTPPAGQPPVAPA
jgi:hypothetical protein